MWSGELSWWGLSRAGGLSQTENSCKGSSVHEGEEVGGTWVVEAGRKPIRYGKLIGYGTWGLGAGRH